MTSTELLQEFKKATFPSGFGFDAFTQDELDHFLNDPSQWGFALKKERGRGILYGKRHTNLRCQLVNDRPKEERLKILGDKFRFFKIPEKLHVMVNNSLHFTISDIVDIGMGNSVYRVTLHLSNGEEMAVVVKQEEWDAQSFFSRLSRELGWPYYRSSHIKDNYGGWQVLDYLGNTTIYDAVTRPEERTDIRLIEAQLAQHAALGDVLGRGDRHFENYLVRHGIVYPIDVSFLFWDGSEEWVWKYIAGGMSEYTLLSLAKSDEEFNERREAFWEVYFNTLKQLATQEELICRNIEECFGEKDPGTAIKTAFVHERLSNYEAFYEAQKQLYDDGHHEMCRRKEMKLKLRELAVSSPQVLEENPWLKMYYLADLDRFSTFFLLEDRAEGSCLLPE
jgi:hypothetical protein